MTLTINYKRRSIWKGFFFPVEFFLLFFSDLNILYLKSRNFLLLRFFFENRLCFFYSGKKFIRLNFISNMEYSKAGQFIFTKKIGAEIHHSKIKQKKGKGLKKKGINIKTRIAVKSIKKKTVKKLKK